MTPSNIPFVKMTGAGNDFVLIDNRMLSLTADWSTMAPGLCDRRYGIGADGVLVLQALSGGADFLMEYYNADGSHGGMCGNGGRCSALYAMEAGLSDEIAFLAVHHLYKAKRLGGNMIRLQMKDISSVRLSEPLDVEDHRLVSHFVDSGTAHVVLMYEELPAILKNGFDAMSIEKIGRAIRNHASYAPGGTNVNIVRQIDAETIAMRTYERGVEGETLACGTGAVASAVVANAIKKCGEKINVITRSHEELCVSFTPVDGRYSDVFLSGPAKIVFRGSFNPDDLASLHSIPNK